MSGAAAESGGGAGPQGAAEAAIAVSRREEPHQR
jgi:hypothetical protein